MATKPSTLITELPMSDIPKLVPLTDEQIAAVVGGCALGDAGEETCREQTPEGKQEVCEKLHEEIHKDEEEPEPNNDEPDENNDEPDENEKDDEYVDRNNNGMCDEGDWPES